MDEVYEITYAGATIGTARVERQGLYYRFSCRCHLPEEGLYRIHAGTEEAYVDLGICVPVDGMFGMDKKVPVKMFGEGKWTFFLRPNDWIPEEPEILQESEEENEEEPLPEDHFIPVSECEPFADLDKLENAVMETRSGETGIVLQKMQ